MATTQTVVLAERPTGDIQPGKTFKVLRSPNLRAEDLKDGQFLVETIYLSLDPAMRGWLNPTRSYVPPVPIGGVMRGAVVARVVASKSRKYEVGCHVYAGCGWREEAIVGEDEGEVWRLDVPEGGRLTDALGVLGITGLTAYFGILDVAKVQPGDFVVVSGAAGATGSVVCQIAKLKGATVLGLTGSDDKISWLKNHLGCDESLNYKSPGFIPNFRAATKSLIDIFFDNVGGEMLDLALSRAKPHARFVMCGAISQYNSAEPKGPRNFLVVISMRIRMEGFIVLDYKDRWEAAREELAKWLAEGKIRRKETIVKGGLGVAEEALLGLYKGTNMGKLLVEVKSTVGESKL